MCELSQVIMVIQHNIIKSKIQIRHRVIVQPHPAAMAFIYHQIQHPASLYSDFTVLGSRLWAYGLQKG